MKTYMKPVIEKIDFATNAVLSGENDIISGKDDGNDDG